MVILYLAVVKSAKNLKKKTLLIKRDSYCMFKNYKSLTYRLNDLSYDQTLLSPTENSKSWFSIRKRLRKSQLKRQLASYVSL